MISTNTPRRFAEMKTINPRNAIEESRQILKYIQEGVNTAAAVITILLLIAAVVGAVVAAQLSLELQRIVIAGGAVLLLTVTVEGFVIRAMRRRLSTDSVVRKLDVVEKKFQEQTQQRSANLELMSQLAPVIASGNDVEERAAGLMLKTLSSLLDDRAQLQFLKCLDDGSWKLLVGDPEPQPEEVHDISKLGTDGGFAGHTLRKHGHRCDYIADVASPEARDKGWIPSDRTQHQVGCMVCVAAQFEPDGSAVGRYAGAITADRPAPGTFSEDERRLICLFATHMRLVFAVETLRQRIAASSQPRGPSR